MRNLTITFSLAAVLLSNSLAQEQAPNQVQLGSKFAEALLVHKEEPAFQKNSGGVKVTGTVVFAITIDKNGNVTPRPYALWTQDTPALCIGDCAQVPLQTLSVQGETGRS